MVQNIITKIQLDDVYANNGYSFWTYEKWVSEK